MAKVTKAIENFIFWWSPSKFLTQLKNFLKTPETLTEMLSNWKRIVTQGLLSSADNLCKQNWHSDSVPERFLWKKLIFEKKLNQKVVTLLFIIKLQRAF